MIQEKVDILIDLLTRYKYGDVHSLYQIADAIWFKLKQNEEKHLFYLNPYYFSNNEN